MLHDVFNFNFFLNTTLKETHNPNLSNIYGLWTLRKNDHSTPKTILENTNERYVTTYTYG